MPITVVLQVECDGFQSKSNGPRKKCARSAEFGDLNVRNAKIAAEEAGWSFSIKGSKDVCFCPKCGPHERPHLYKK